MVPGPRIRESRSPLDSRGPLPRRRGASSFYAGRSALRLRSRGHGVSVRAACRSQPLEVAPRGALSFLPPAPPCAKDGPHASLRGAVRRRSNPERKHGDAGMLRLRSAQALSGMTNAGGACHPGFIPGSPYFICILMLLLLTTKQNCYSLSHES